MTPAALIVPGRPEVGLRPEATAAWRELVEALIELDDLDLRTPCHGEPAFLSTDAEDRLMAAKACRHCPVLSPCGAFAAANLEAAGVWGGRDRTCSGSGELTTRSEDEQRFTHAQTSGGDRL